MNIRRRSRTALAASALVVTAGCMAADGGAVRGADARGGDRSPQVVAGHATAVPGASQVGASPPAPPTAHLRPHEIASTLEVRLRRASATAATARASGQPGGGPAPAEVASATAADGRGTGHGRKAPGQTVRGGFVNDVSCIPLDAGTSGNGYEVECTGGSWWNGDLTGRATVYWKGYVSPKIEIDSAYDETFVGTYAGDDTVGGFRLRGRFTLDENGAFSAHAEIIEGTCAWVGSTGTFEYHGYSTNGGYVGTWNRPVPRPATEPACDPTMLPFDPVDRLAPTGPGRP